MKRLDMKMYRNKSLTMKVLLGLVLAGSFLPRQAEAQVPNSISSFVTCVNQVKAAGGSVAETALMCVPPSGCYYTNTLSEESSQNACTLRDGTRLPRVIFSCTGPGGSQTLRFRPSFSLCTLGNDLTNSVINHIELGEDVTQKIDRQTVQKMGSIDMTGHDTPFPLTEYAANGGVYDSATPPRNLGCNDCHDRLGSVPVGSNVAYLFGQIIPALADGTIGSNDPSVPKPASPVPLSVICADIFNSKQLAKNPTKKAQAFALCSALLFKEH